MWFTLIISVMGLFLLILNGIAEWGQKDVSMIVYIVVMIFYSINLIVFAIKLLKTIKKKKKSNIAKWRKYVLRVVEELLQEQK